MDFDAPLCPMFAARCSYYNKFVLYTFEYEQKSLFCTCRLFSVFKMIFLIFLSVSGRNFGSEIYKNTGSHIIIALIIYWKIQYNSKMIITIILSQLPALSTYCTGRGAPSLITRNLRKFFFVFKILSDARNVTLLVVRWS